MKLVRYADNGPGEHLGILEDGGVIAIDTVVASLGGQSDMVAVIDDFPNLRAELERLAPVIAQLYRPLIEHIDHEWRRRVR
jgi:hypothetical protein